MQYLGQLEIGELGRKGDFEEGLLLVLKRPAEVQDQLERAKGLRGEHRGQELQLAQPCAFHASQFVSDQFADGPAVPEGQYRYLERGSAFQRERRDEEYVAEGPEDSFKLAERQGEHTARNKQRVAESIATDARRGQQQYRHIYEYKCGRCQSEWIVSRRSLQI